MSVPTRRRFPTAVERTGHAWKARSGDSELLVAVGQPVRIGTVGAASGDGHERLAVMCLEPMQEHGSVDFLQEAPVDRNDIVGPDPQYISVVGSVVDLAQGQTVRHDRFSVRVRIRDDMGRVQ